MSEANTPNTPFCVHQWTSETETWIHGAFDSAEQAISAASQLALDYRGESYDIKQGDTYLATVEIDDEGEVLVTPAPPTKGVRGIWTPWAEVLCYACHGPTFPNSTVTDEEMAVFATPVSDDGEAEGFTVCDKCGCDVILDEDIAMQHAVCRRLNAAGGFTARLEQTGGMCCNARILIEGAAICVVLSCEFRAAWVSAQEWPENKATESYIHYYRLDCDQPDEGFDSDAVVEYILSLKGTELTVGDLEQIG